MRNSFLLLVSAALVGACGSPSSSSSETSSSAASSGSEASPAFTNVSVEAVAARAPSVAVFDANSRETFDLHHVPGATWVHYDSVTADVLPADPSTPLVFYCANESCSASHVAAETAASLGHTDVAVMGAGIQGWIAAGQPTETGAPASAATP